MSALGVKVRSDDRHKAGGPLKSGRDFPSKAELKLLIDRAPERWRPFIVTAIFTGMRASELRGLRWCDVDFDNATIHVAQRADTWGKMGSPKSAAGTQRHSADADGRQYAPAMELSAASWYSPITPAG